MLCSVRTHPTRSFDALAAGGVEDFVAVWHLILVKTRSRFGSGHLKAYQHKGWSAGGVIVFSGNFPTTIESGRAMTRIGVPSANQTVQANAPLDANMSHSIFFTAPCCPPSSVRT